jgi:glycosyltransferase involved in cell wall biosynthesis
MGRRLTIGLRYKQKEAWIGGQYYVRNLVSALGLLPAQTRPRLVAVGGEKAAVEELRQATGYEDLRRLSRTRIEPVPAPLIDLGRRTAEEELSLILMGSPPGLEARGVQWVPDFQEHRFPEFFDEAELGERHRRNAGWFDAHRHVMVSSEDVAADLRRFYPRPGQQVHVVRFASFLPDSPPTDIGPLRARYGLPERWFLCANQVWKHKNHAVVLRALAEAGPEGPTIAFTGLEDDYRDAAYAPSIRALAAELGVADRARFLGFIPRADQLALMRGAIAVVQPSLCEGWSTVVEDAKALGRHVLASSIAVHREQLSEGADFFSPADHVALAGLLMRYAKSDPPPVRLDYDACRRRFSEDLWRMILEVERDLRRRRVPRLVIRA